MIYQPTSRLGNASHTPVQIPFLSGNDSSPLSITHRRPSHVHYQLKDSLITFYDAVEKHNLTHRVITGIDHREHMFPWCRRRESLVMVFTLYSGPGSWKTNNSLPVNERSLINNVTPMTEISGTSPLMAPVDRQALATRAVQLQQRICYPA